MCDCLAEVRIEFDDDEQYERLNELENTVV